MDEENRKVILNKIDKIEQYAKANPWLFDDLRKRFGNEHNSKIDEIYEYCIERVIKEQATQFYKYFPITELKKQLIEDYCRMERFRRKDDFEDFCLAVFQQVECITNWFCLRPKFIDLYNDKKNENSNIVDKEKNPISIGSLIIQSEYEKRKETPLIKLFLNERIRAVLYFVYFAEKTVKYAFDSKYGEMNELYQCRNLNHRGGDRSDYQENIVSEILPHQYQYYLKFTGLLVDYIEHISRFMSKKEELGVVSSVLPSAVYIKPENSEIFVIDKGKLWHKVKSLLQKGDKVIIERNSITNEILNINLVNGK